MLSRTWSLGGPGAVDVLVGWGPGQPLRSGDRGRVRDPQPGLGLLGAIEASGLFWNITDGPSLVFRCECIWAHLFPSR